jgi:D-xylose transport system substrate-binding protein
MAEGKAVEGEVQTKTESGKDQPAILLTPVGITRDNLDVVVKANWITKEKLCDGVTTNPPDACK